jgi:hypothetical protein
VLQKHSETNVNVPDTLRTSFVLAITVHIRTLLTHLREAYPARLQHGDRAEDACQRHHCCLGRNSVRSLYTGNSITRWFGRENGMHSGTVIIAQVQGGQGVYLRLEHVHALMKRPYQQPPMLLCQH